MAQELFRKIKSLHDKNRQLELERLRDEYRTYTAYYHMERNAIQEKYEHLIDRYANHPNILEDIFEWEQDALAPVDQRITGIDNSIQFIKTPLKERTDDFELVNFNVRELREIRKRFSSLRDQYWPDYESYSPQNPAPTAPPQIEEEYRTLFDRNIKMLHARYVFLHDLVPDVGYLPLEKLLDYFPTTNNYFPSLKMHFNHFKWGVVCFEPNHKFWEAQASNELKEIVYTNFKIFDDSENITPIENRLKDELDARGLKYKFQYPVGRYVLDFYLEANGVCLNVECDGKEYHSSPAAIEHDRIRNNVMATNGIYVLRFSGSEIWKDAVRCVDFIESALSRKG
jgi:very-short-patch-repair endonuclease